MLTFYHSWSYFLILINSELWPNFPEIILIFTIQSSSHKLFVDIKYFILYFMRSTYVYLTDSKGSVLISLYSLFSLSTQNLKTSTSVSSKQCIGIILLKKMWHTIRYAKLINELKIRYKFLLISYYASLTLN